MNDSPPSKVEIVSPENGEQFEKSEVYLLANFINNGGGIQEIKLLQNGKRIPVDASDVQRMKKAGQNYMKTINLSLIPGDNTISISAINNGKIESKPATIVVNYKGQPKTANCYLVAVGINKYENERLNLNYAKADAESFVKRIETSGQKLFKNIEVSVLYDKEATKENIENLLVNLSVKVLKEDVFIFYYAGHGSVVDNNFYFIPTDNISLYQPEKLEEEAIYAGDLQEKFKNIKALKQIVILDACHSGSSTQILAQRGASEEKALAQISRSSGVHVLASAGSEQQAAEVGKLGHGVFTYVLLEALAGNADGAPKDGKITIYELKSYLDDQVPEVSKKHIGHKQYPTTFSSGHDFPIVLE